MSEKYYVIYVQSKEEIPGAVLDQLRVKDFGFTKEEAIRYRDSIDKSRKPRVVMEIE